MMKRIAALLTALALMMGLVTGLAADGAETVKFKKLTVQTDIEELDMGKVTVGSGDFKKFYAFLDQLPNLKKLDMFSTRLSTKQVKTLTERYPDIEIGFTTKVGGMTLRSDATSFSTRHSSHKKGARYNSETFTVLRHCKNLMALDIGHNAVDDLSFLYDLPKLRVLILAGNKISDITPIGSLRDLQYLELFQNYVTDISPLAECHELVDLNLCLNKIEDLSPLHGLTKLRRLWVNHYLSRSLKVPLDEAAIAALKEHLPDTEINTDASQPTAGGWRRKGSHYETIVKIFKAKTGHYMPFDDVPEPGAGEGE